MSASMGKLFIISAPSGAGKTSLVKATLENIGEQCSLALVITYTTKKPRDGDINGKDYHFLTVEQFEQKIQEDFFLEWSLAYGHYYGSPKNIVSSLEQGCSSIMILDRSGAQTISNLISESILIWISVSEIDILRQRLLLRKSENFEQIHTRILLAQKEIEEENNKKVFKYTVNNDIFARALLELESIIKRELFLS